ncbi:MAG: ethanolamine ammonia-lyase subunit EutC [Desulforhopalus sp.]|nr:ethanolamine ammonia-lyase subunit EutC [Desulforhopalus sp.]
MTTKKYRKYTCAGDGSLISADPWTKLRQFTDARVALGRTEVSLPLQEFLRFKLAPVKARAAVYQRVDVKDISSAFDRLQRPLVSLNSRAGSREEYLSCPDKGRHLDTCSQEQLQNQEQGFDLCIVICDGFSAPAIYQNAIPFADGLLKIIEQTTLTAAPVCFVSNGRVAVGDEIGHLLQAKMVVTLIGERPGLGSPNPLGACLTWNPQPGLTDESRNCISNIRQGGLPVAEGIRKAAYLIERAFEIRKTGVELEDKMEDQYVPLAGMQQKDRGNVR